MNTPKDIPLFQFAVDFEQSKCLQTGCTFDSKPFVRFGMECFVTLHIQEEEDELPIMGAALTIKTRECISYDVKFYLKNFSQEGLDCTLDVGGVKEKVMTSTGMCFTNTMKTPDIVRCEDLVERLGNKQNWVHNNHIRFIVEVSNIYPVPCSVNAPQAWTDQLHTMLFDKNTSDIVIVTGDVRIPCHKLVLCLASPVFQAMFENQMQESVSNEIVISDFSEEVVRSFLKCIYDQTSVGNELSTHTQHLLFIANKYEVTFLSKLTRNFLINNITKDNAIDMLIFAHQFEETDIKAAAMTVLAEKSSFFMKKANFADMLGSVLLAEFLIFMADNYTFLPVAKKVCK